jgi:cell division protease FtsH
MAESGPDSQNKKPKKNNKGKAPQESKKPWNIIFWVLIFGLLLLGLNQSDQSLSDDDRPTLKTLRKDLDKYIVKRVILKDNEVTWILGDEGKPKDRPNKNVAIVTEIPDDLRVIIDDKVNKGLEVHRMSAWLIFLMQYGPWLLFIFLFYFFFFRKINSAGGGNIFSFGKSRAKLISSEAINKTFKDVAGVDEAKEELTEIVAFLKEPEKFTKLGGRLPRGVLLNGPPGTGKTLLAKAIAGEAGVPFYTISGSDFVEMFVGVGASRVRDLFTQAKENSPAIIFLDEIDAVGRKRGSGLGGGHDEREQTLNAILVEMDGFESDTSVIVIASTNRVDVLDPALLRPGRFDRHVSVNLPDIEGRKAILKVHSKKIKLDDNANLGTVAQGTPGFSGADLENLLNESALIAVAKDKKCVDTDDLESARDKVAFGKEKKSAVIHQDDLKITAFHESGHAFVSLSIPQATPLHKLTIIPRGDYLGAAFYLPTRDETHRSKNFLVGQICIAYGGRIAEEVFFGDITTGASNDIKQATSIARRMVSEWGMSEKLGLLNYEAGEDRMFLGGEISKSKTHSEETAKLLDEEVTRITRECYDNAKKIITDNKEVITKIAESLLEYETLTGEEVQNIIDGKELTRKPPMKKIKDPNAVQEKIEEIVEEETEKPESEDSNSSVDTSA